MIVRAAGVEDIAAWAAMRDALWPGEDAAELRAELAGMLAEAGLASGGLANLLAVDGEGQALGFVEAALRHDYVNGCETSPVLFLEGLYVRPEARRTGVARALVAAARDWGRARGCTEMASDADIANADSYAFHAAIGFEETERVVYFRAGI